jgi:hypothetical protein
VPQKRPLASAKDPAEMRCGKTRGFGTQLVRGVVEVF